MKTTDSINVNVIDIDCQLQNISIAINAFSSQIYSKIY